MQRELGAQCGAWGMLVQLILTGASRSLLGILAALLAIAGTVNYFRWGSATTFADYRFYLGNE